MKPKSHSWMALLFTLFTAALACNLPNALVGGTTALPPADTPVPPPSPQPSATEEAATPTLEPVFVTVTTIIPHLMKPSDLVKPGKLVYDVQSQDTAPEKRAPYGDSYKINRFERPFLQDMSYVSEMDIVTYNVGQENDWYYVSVELIGTDPNNGLGINYGVELDLDHDGFGDYILWAQPPYTPEWRTDGVQVFQDKNHNTGGLSAAKSDAPIETDGYETQIFDSGTGNDPDLAWVRINAGREATIQFAFKKSLAGKSFMIGVVSDAGLRDVTKMDYNDRFKEEDAGSPEKSEKYYPLKALYAVDNACRSAYGFQPTGEEPQLCPVDEPPPTRKTPQLCPPPVTYVCPNWDPVNCRCNLPQPPPPVP